MRQDAGTKVAGWLRVTSAAIVSFAVWGLAACPSPTSNRQDTTTPRLSTTGGAPQAGPEPGEPNEAGDEGQQGPVAGGHVPGQFDYYVLSLSWSPQFCATRGKQARPDDPQCGVGVAFGFVLHGLWPQYSARGYPESCTVGTAPDATLVQRMLRIMPSPRLVQHEWQKHGTCSGLSPERYFAQAESLFSGLRIPARYQHPGEPVATTVAELRQELMQENPSLLPDSIAVYCRGPMLREVRICYSKDFRPQSCSATVRDGCPRTGITVLPVRSSASGAN
ncbi:MAG: ribonuclease T2 [Myxococcales bacterium]|nr:ribonuclease T2 [Myxococcales bacterium]